MDEDFLLENDFSKQLYHNYASKMPIIDYHNHLPPKEIAENKQFENISQIWLYGDHYKWRAMRANGVLEKYITGLGTDWEKFEQWAATMPYTMRNPLYHWSHLELHRYFEIDDLLKPESAKAIYQQANKLLQQDDYRVQALLEKMQVKVLCTTDDPLDDLAYHQAIAKSEFMVKVFPAFRPDKAIQIEKAGFLDYMRALEKAASIDILNWQNLQDALESRMDYFHQNGCRISDHGLEQVIVVEYTEQEVDRILQKRLAGSPLDELEIHKFQSALIYWLCLNYHKRTWVQQLHLGALRNNNSRLLKALGPDTGFDSMGDFSQAQALSKLLNRLDNTNQLAKTILYNLNPRDNEVFATMVGNFNDGTVVGKMQYGSAWWFLDQLDGMEKQLNVLSNMGLISRFIGMLTDSRSFLSFPRHEYFRRLLCNMFGKDIQNGLLPSDIPWIGQMIQDICYNNAQSYFEFDQISIQT